MFNLRSRLLSALTLASVTFSSACGPAEPTADTDSPAEALAWREDAALAESLNTTPTAAWWYYGQTAEQVSTLVSANDARIISLQVEQASPLRFTVSLVRNTGTYAKGWWWYYGLTASQLSSYLSTNNARIASLSPYEIDGTTYFAAVMISNTGADAKGWWWYYGTTPAQISTYLQQNNARLVDLASYATSAGTRYAAVMINNTGADAKGWWWYLGVTGSQISSYLAQNNGFLTDIQPADASGSTFNVIMEQNPGIAWWWYYGATSSQLADALAQNGARLLDVKTYTSGGVRKFAAIMVNNSNAATTRIGELMRDGTDGDTGHYVKQVGGSVQASLQGNLVFEPASTIKALIGLHAMREVDAGRASLNQLVNIYAPSSGSCPTSTITGTETLGNAIYNMLEFSDNQRTRAVIDAFGFAPINQTADAAGMTSTQLNHYPGCGGPVANALTLADAGRMYEGIANGTLLSAASRTALYQRMPEQAGDFTGIRSALRTLVDQEGASLGLSATALTQYKNRLVSHYKAGNYTLCGSGACLEYISVAGVAEVPRCSLGATSTQNYVWGIFISGASNKTAASNTFQAAKVEPLREPIRAALTNWGGCFP
ncbi:serine hydrolase [Cystobacter fuscus]|uniref:serine hydrolase n=1 Tax=Cystobacter fuscus TaxID=43 RepID=UPI002B2C64BA|nr:serine hydrolase [Cystobacter fuscus]